MEQDSDAAVVIITAHGAVSIAVEAIKAGASDFVAKPWSNERLAATVEAQRRSVAAAWTHGPSAAAHPSWRQPARLR